MVPPLHAMEPTHEIVLLGNSAGRRYRVIGGLRTRLLTEPQRGRVGPSGLLQPAGFPLAGPRLNWRIATAAQLAWDRAMQNVNCAGVSTPLSMVSPEFGRSHIFQILPWKGVSVNRVLLRFCCGGLGGAGFQPAFC